MLVAQYSLSQLEPAFDRNLASARPVRLPYGGPTGTGGRFAKGTVLGCVGGTAQSEVATLTLGGTSSGTVTATFTGDKVYQVTWTVGATNASVQTAWEAVFGAGNVAVTGTSAGATDGTVILTFQNQLANVRIGGLFAATVTAGTSTWARTTRGSAGAGQFDRYLDAGTLNTPTTARSVLATDYLSTPQGELVTEGVRSGQAYSPLAWVAGFFNVGDLTGLDANGVADPGWRIVEGAAITDTGAVVGLGV